MSELLDELARSLAKPMSRSRSLRLLAGALVAAATPSALGRRAPAARAGRRAAAGCFTSTCAYRPTSFVCPDPGDSNPGAPCGPPHGVPNCCEGGQRCCSDGPPGGNFPGRCTGSSEVSVEGFYCCPRDCECYKGICCAPGTMRGVDKTGFPICCERDEALCDQPQAQGGVICCKKSCGPDITDELEKALGRVRSEFGRWGAVKRYNACLDLVTLPGAAFVWDIRELGPGGRQAFTNRYRGCDGCGNSVQVGRGCHYSGSVNYVAYGVMMRLCHDYLASESSAFADWFSSNEMLELVYMHKNKTGTPAANFQASNNWALAGYHSKSIRPIPPGDRPECTERCSKPYSGAGMTVNWLPFVIGPG